MPVTVYRYANEGWVCPVIGCYSTYSVPGSLKTHLNAKHANQDFADIEDPSHQQPPTSPAKPEDTAVLAVPADTASLNQLSPAPMSPCDLNGMKSSPVYFADPDTRDPLETELGICYEPQFGGVIVCLQCALIVDRQLASHLSFSHGITGTRIREATHEFLQKYPITPGDRIDLGDPEIPIQHIEGIPVTRACDCPTCGNVVGLPDTLQRHMAKHGRSITLGEARDRQVVYVQQPFSMNRQPRRVIRPPLHADPNTSDILQSYVDSKKVQLAPGIDSNPGNGDVSPWYQNSGISRHLADTALKAIRLLRLLPYKKDPLHWASTEVDQLFRTYLKTYEARAVDVTRRWMDSGSMTQMSTNYFDKCQEATKKQYISYFQSFVVYNLRVSQCEDVGTEFATAKLVHKTPTQQTQLREMWTAVTNQNAESFQVALHSFFTSCIQHKLSDGIGHEFHSLLLHWVATYCISDSDNLKYPASMSTTFAGLLWGLRLATFGWVVQAAVTKNQGLNVGDERWTTTNTLYESRLSYVCAEGETPGGWIVRKLRETRGIASREAARPTVSWSLDRTYMRVHGQKMTMESVRNFVHEMWEELLTAMVAVGISWARLERKAPEIMDDMSSNRAGYYYLNDERNGHFKDYLKHTVLVENKFELVKVLNGRTLWNTVAITDYLRLIEDVTDRLLVLFYVLGGQAPRQSELLAMKYYNHKTNPRNVFIHDGVVMFQTNHDKSQWSSGKSSAVLRFLPHAFVPVYTIFINEIIPMKHHLAGKVTQKLPEGDWQRSLLFTDLHGHALKSTHLSHVMKHFTTTKGLPPMGVATWRHGSISMSRRCVRFGKGFEEDEQEDDVWDAQASHSTYISNKAYGKADDLRHSVTEASISAYSEISFEWWRYLHAPGVSQSEPLVPVTQEIETTGAPPSFQGVPLKRRLVGTSEWLQAARPEVKRHVSFSEKISTSVV